MLVVLSSFRRLRVAMLTGAMLAGMFVALPLADGGHQDAAAQQAQPWIDFNTALGPYGEWRKHARWGNVWVPSYRDRNWQPYQEGRWVYTEQWGWYWVSNAEESDWGWVAYHYGRWIKDRDLGWAWVPGDEWAPAWVKWRRGPLYVGWAPLAPDEVADSHFDDPEIWMFVAVGDLAVTRPMLLPERQGATFVRETVVVNRTLPLRAGNARIAVNPGVSASIIAAAAGRTVPIHEVRPKVLAGTRGVAGAVEIRASEIREDRARRRRGRERMRETVTERTSLAVGPVTTIPAAQPLGPNEKGRLDDLPLRAAQGMAPVAAAPPAAAEPSSLLPSLLPALLGGLGITDKQPPESKPAPQPLRQRARPDRQRKESSTAKPTAPKPPTMAGPTAPKPPSAPTAAAPTASAPAAASPAGAKPLGFDTDKKL
ncbi:MAG: hypothetical protein JWN71_1932 [Xanthobacteraceae bacterium]|nr:hypothetical protein [Xanthobacteraceae bacterium]